MGSLDRQRYQRFLAKLRQARKEAGLSQVEVAKALRRPQTFVSKFELGERRLDFVEVEILAELYGKPLVYFRTRGG